MFVDIYKYMTERFVLFTKSYLSSKIIIMNKTPVGSIFKSNNVFAIFTVLWFLHHFDRFFTIYWSNIHCLYKNISIKWAALTTRGVHNHPQRLISKIRLLVFCRSFCLIPSSLYSTLICFTCSFDITNPVGSGYQSNVCYFVICNKWAKYYFISLSWVLFFFHFISTSSSPHRLNCHYILYQFFRSQWIISGILSVSLKAGWFFKHITEEQSDQHTSSSWAWWILLVAVYMINGTFYRFSCLPSCRLQW